MSDRILDMTGILENHQDIPLVEKKSDQSSHNLKIKPKEENKHQTFQVGKHNDEEELDLFLITEMSTFPCGIRKTSTGSLGEPG